MLSTHLYDKNTIRRILLHFRTPLLIRRCDFSPVFRENSHRGGEHREEAFAAAESGRSLGTGHGQCFGMWRSPIRGQN